MSTTSELLQSALAEYRRAEKELSEYRAKAETAQRDGELAIDDRTVSEDEVALRLFKGHAIAGQGKSKGNRAGEAY